MTKTKRPIADVLGLAERVVEELRPFCSRIELAGSLHRRVEQVGDIEIVAIPKTRQEEKKSPQGLLFPDDKPVMHDINCLWQYLESVESEGKLTFAKRGPKYRQFTYRGNQVDLFTATPENWGWIYLIRTGSKEFSHHMATSLRKNGLSSREGRIVRVVRDTVFATIDTPEERDVFRVAGQTWRDPYSRSW